MVAEDIEFSGTPPEIRKAAQEATEKPTVVKI